MLSTEQLDELRTQHKKIAHVADKHGEWEAVYRRPTSAEYKRFRAMLHNDAQKADATEWLARACVVHPTRDQFNALLDEFPAIADASGTALGELVGFTADQSAK